MDGSSTARGSDLSLRVHIPRSLPSSHSASFLSLSTHLRALRSAPRRDLVQGERLGVYVVVPPPVLERHGWLAQAWGPRLVAQERAARARAHVMCGQNDAPSEEEDRAADESVLARLHPCPLRLRVTLRSAPPAEVASAGEEDEDDAASWRPAANGEEAEGEGDVERGMDGSDGEADDDEEELRLPPLRSGSASPRPPSHDDSDTPQPRASPPPSRSLSPALAPLSRSASGSRTGASTPTAQAGRATPNVAAAALAASSLPSAVPAAAPSALASLASRLAFRKSTTPMRPTAAPTPAHQPSRLAPGYVPPFSARGARADTQPVLSHAQGEVHAAPAEGDAEQTTVHYFYARLDQPTDAALQPDPAGGIAAYGSLVLFVQTTLSIQPSFLSSSPSLLVSPSDSDSNGGSGLRQALALEVDVLCPPAPQHALLNSCALHLPGAPSLFLLDKLPPGVTPAPLPEQGQGLAERGTANLRSFVAANRALSVPHSIPTARRYVAVFDPLQLASKAVFVGYTGGGGGSDAADAEVVWQLSMRNVCTHWHLRIDALDLLLNRTRLVLRAPPSLSDSPSPNPSRSSTRVAYLPMGSFCTLRVHAPEGWPATLAPGEQLNVLAFLTLPRGQARADMERAIADLLAPDVPPASSLLAVLPPLRTPWVVRYGVELPNNAAAASDETHAGVSVLSQGRIVWRMRRSATSAVASQASTDPAIMPLPSPSPTVSSPLPPPDSLSLNAQLKFPSPAPLQRRFAIFLCLRNLGSSPTPALHLRVLPPSHPLLRAQRRERAHARRDLLASPGSVAAAGLFSPSRSPPPLLYSPSSAAALPAASFASPRSAGSTESGASGDGAAELHFPFRPVARRGSTENVGRRTPPPPSSATAGHDSARPTSLHVSTNSVGGAGAGENVFPATLSHFLAVDTAVPQAGLPHAHMHDKEALVDDEGLARSHTFRLALFTLSPAFLSHASSPFALVALCAAALASGLVCLESDLPLGSIAPGGERAATLHFLATRDGMMPLDAIVLHDPAADAYWRLAHQPALFVTRD